MRILLPPSETKVSGGTLPPIATPIAFGDAERVSDARARVRDALDTLMQDTDAAAKALKLGVKSRSEMQHNTLLDSSGVLPAIDRYTGVLFDAIELDTLSGDARSYIEGTVFVQSALFGLIRADSPIPAYRLSGGTRLPALGSPLRRVWGSTYTVTDWEDSPWVLDLRSQDYASLAPIPVETGVYLDIAQRAPDGSLKSLNHFNKAAKGRLVRLLADECPQVGSLRDFSGWCAAHDIEIVSGTSSAHATAVFPVSLHG